MNALLLVSMSMFLKPGSLLKRGIGLTLTLFFVALLAWASGASGTGGFGDVAGIGGAGDGAGAAEFVSEAVFISAADVVSAAEAAGMTDASGMAETAGLKDAAGMTEAAGAAVAGNFSSALPGLAGPSPGGDTTVPLREVFESLGANVSWDGAARSVLVVMPGKEVRLYVGGAVLLNGRRLAADVPIELVDGVTRIPLSLVGEILGAPVEWDGHTGSLYVDGEKISAGAGAGPGGSQPAAVQGSGGTAAPYPQKLEPTLASAGYRYPLWLSKDGHTLYTGLYSKTLSRSSGELETLTSIHTFDCNISGCRELANGELLVACGNAGVPGALWLSSGNQTTWKKVMEASSANARFTNEWSLSTHGKIVVASEYGGKTPPDNARKVYLSLDSGVTWKEILDIGQRENAHVHSCAYDPYEARIWAASGDSPNSAILCSDDWGTTWTTVSTDLVTSIVPLPDCVLFGTHQPPNGIIRYNRAGTGKGAAPGFEYAYYIDREERNVTYCASTAFQGEPGGPVYFSFLVAGTGDKPGLIVATKDGANFYEVYRDTAQYAPGKGVVNLLGPTAGGKLIGLIHDDRQDSYSILKAEAQLWPDAAPPAPPAPPDPRVPPVPPVTHVPKLTPGPRTPQASPSPPAAPAPPAISPAGQGGQAASGAAEGSGGVAGGSGNTGASGAAGKGGPGDTGASGVTGRPGAAPGSRAAPSSGATIGSSAEGAVLPPGRTAPAGGGEAKVPSPLKLTPAITSANFQYPMWLAGDGKTLYTGWDSKTLKKSVDDLKTLTTIHTFEVYLTACRELDNGELLAACGNPGVPASLWLSSKGQTEWTKVLETSSAKARFMNEWSLSVSGRIALASEYGGKEPPYNARKVYLSRDYGKTWAEILDIGQREGTHVHSCAFDPYYNRIWVTTGDMPHQSILYSDDWGKTWKVASIQYQATSIFPLPGCVLFGSDSSPNGILRCTRAGKSNPPVIEVAYRIDDSPRLTYNAKLVFQGRQPGAPVFFPYIVKVSSGRLPGLVIATLDGFTFFEVFRDSISYEVQKGVFNLLGPTHRGKLIGLLYDGRQQSYSLITADAQEWVEPE